MKCAKYVAGMMLFMSIAVPVSATERKMFLALKAGGGGIQVNSEHAINGVAEDEDIFSAGVYTGYNFDSGLVAEVGFSGETSEDIFESYDLFQFMAMLGYTVHAGTDFTFVPKFGFSIWELDSFESGLFNFGRDEERSFDGTDPVWSLEGEYFLNELVQMNLSYTQGSYDFGDLDSFRFGVEFDFE